MTRRPDLQAAPLRQWGDAQRIAANPQRERFRILALSAGASALLLLGLTWQPGVRLLWNPTASAPRGLYLLLPVRDLEPAQMVAASVPDGVRSLAARRGYIPSGIPLIKRIAARRGDLVCASGRQLRIGNRHAIARRLTDAAGRPLPLWQGCRRLGGDQVLLLMSEHPASFDGRYFGPSPRQDVLGRVILLWRS